MKFISESDFSVRGDYKKTWNYIKEGVHSLERHTNFANCFNIVLQQLKHSEKKIVIFGAGIAGKYVLDICHKQGIQAACFCDNKLPEESYANGLTVHRLQRLAESGEDYCFIISIMDIEFIRNELEAFGFHDWVSIYNLYMPKKRSQKESFWDYHRLESVWYAHKNYECRDQLNLNSLDVVITERCSLKCRECSNLMQYYQAPQNFPLDDLKKEIERVLSVCDEIYEIRVIGGEPFMHPELADILGFLAEKKQICHVSIWTNATIAPTEQQLQVMKKYGIWLSISNYGDLSRNLKVMLEKLDVYGIDYICKDIDYWTKCSTFSKWNRTKEDLKKVYEECCVRKLTTLLKGRIYSCPFIANAMNLGAIPDQAGDYVDIMGNDADRKKKLRNLLENQQGLFSCDYCAGRPILVQEKDKIAPHEQVKEALPITEG